MDALAAAVAVMHVDIDDFADGDSEQRATDIPPSGNGPRQPAIEATDAEKENIGPEKCTVRNCGLATAAELKRCEEHRLNGVLHSEWNDTK